MTAPEHRAVALVESPAQLLNAIEWAWAEATRRTSGSAKPAGKFGRDVAIRVLAPMEPTGRIQLHRMCELARSGGFDIGWHEVRGPGRARWRELATVASEISRADTVVIGDPFSSTIQFLIGLIGPRQIVVVDDGSATLEFVEIISAGRALARWHESRSSSAVARLTAAVARRRMIPPAARPNEAGSTAERATADLRLFTSMPVSNPGLTVERNELDWVRERFPAPQVITGETGLVGTSLAESEIVEEKHYLRAVQMLAETHGARRYLAHRRESIAKLTRVEDIGLEIVRPELPLEIFARIGPTPAKIISFPSTVVHTLPLALSDVEVEVLVCDIDQHWFDPEHVGSRTSHFLSSVTEAARSTYGLGVVDVG